MINEAKVNEICMRNNLTKLSISKYPTWVDKNRQEGMHLEAGKIESFWIKDGEKVYSEAPGLHIENIMKEIMKEDGNDEKNTETHDKKDEQTGTKAETKQPEKEDRAIALLPDILTPVLISKWETMRTVDRMLMFQKTPKDQIFERKAGKDENGKNVVVSYVKGNYMIKEANAAFLFDWRFIHQGLSISDVAVCVYGTLEANVDGKTMSRPAVGYEEINKKMTAQLAIKSATTDAIKKGLSLFGFNSDVYGGEV